MDDRERVLQPPLTQVLQPPLSRYYDRWILPVLGCNRGTVYDKRPVGSSPELMPLDANLNKDLKDCLFRHVLATLMLKTGNPLKFDISSPQRISNAVHRIITGALSSERILQDCFRVLESLQLIVKAHGTVVHGCGQRPGKRNVPGNGLPQGALTPPPPQYSNLLFAGGTRVKGPPIAVGWLHADAASQREISIARSVERSKKVRLDDQVVEEVHEVNDENDDVELGDELGNAEVVLVFGNPNENGIVEEWDS